MVELNKVQIASQIIFFISMRRGYFWFKNGFQDMEHFVQPLDFMISGAKINSLTANVQTSRNSLHWTTTLFGKPFFFNLFNGHCYTMQLNQTNKIISVIIRINTGIKIFPHSANKIQTLANPSWYEALHRNYR